MPFGLKNAEATYHWLMNKMFKEQIGHNIEIYIDDILVKSHASRNHVDDMEETFTTLHKY